MTMLNPLYWVSKKLMKFVKCTWPVLMAVAPLVLFIAPHASAVTISEIAKNTGSSMGSVAELLEDVSLITGIGFIMASFFKFHQHKLNPQQVPISQGIVLLLIGGGLTIFPALLPAGGKALAGSGASFGSLSDLSGSALISNLKDSGSAPK
jgi:intracellular multiplication protein IcmD